jgi:drug/metabolite transporter (DMT)-like permease
MNRRLPFNLPKVSDALNGVIAFGRQAAVLNPFAYKHKGTHGKAIFALIIVCFFWGTTWVASKEGVRYMPALQLAGIRQMIAGLLYVFYFLTIRKAALPKGAEWRPIIVLSVLNFMLSNALSTWGVKYISAGLGSIIGSIFPLWLVLIGMFGAGTAVNKKASFGLAFGFTGICVIFYQHLQDFLVADFRLGIFLSVASTWSWAIGTLYTKKEAVNFNPYFSLGLQMLISGPLVYLVSSVTNNAVPFTAIPWQSWAAIAYLVVFGSVISFIAYLYALQNLPMEQTSLYAYINPVVALLTGALIFGEKLTLPIIAGVLITLYGVRLVNKAVKAGE